MRLIAKRDFQIDHPILIDKIDCHDALLRNDSGNYILYSSAGGLGEILVQLSAVAAHGWLNSTPDEYGIEWLDRTTAP